MVVTCAVRLNREEANSVPRGSFSQERDHAEIPILGLWAVESLTGQIDLLGYASALRAVPLKSEKLPLPTPKSIGGSSESLTLLLAT